MAERDPNWRTMAHNRLDDILAEIEVLEGQQDLSIGAAGLLANAALLVSEICGTEIVQSAYGPIETTDRAALLHAISSRLRLADNLFSAAELRGHDGSLSRVAGEAQAVAIGDGPVLFKKLEGSNKSPKRVAIAKMRALEWEAYLEGLGHKKGDRQTAVSAAFKTNWPSIQQDWYSQVDALFAEGWLSNRLKQQRKAGEYYAENQHRHPRIKSAAGPSGHLDPQFHYPADLSPTDIDGMLRFDGAWYKKMKDEKSGKNDNSF